MTNIELIKSIYEVYGRKDIPAIQAQLAEDVLWIDPGAPAIPYAGTYRGKSQVGEFFAKIEASTEITGFRPQRFFAEGDRVVVLGDYQSKSKATGRTAHSEWAMEWVVSNGKVTRFQAYLDTATIGAIYRAAAGA